MRAVKDEASKKIAVLEAQNATAAAESKAFVEDRLAHVRSDYEGRTKRLQEALNRRKAARAASAA
jgi:hypothetical protein